MAALGPLHADVARLALRVVRAFRDRDRVLVLFLGAEQCHAEKQYKDAVAVAVAKCADDTKGQTCYICMEGAERRHTANEGLVRMCACRGTAGFVHVSCLAEQAKILVAEGKENNLGNKAICLLYTSPSPRDATLSRMPSSA